MNETTHEPLHLTGEELATLFELLESAHSKLLIEIRHTDHRSYRNELRRRLELIEHLIGICRPHPSSRGESATYSHEHELGAGRS
jgi:hypothetical protein